METASWRTCLGHDGMRPPKFRPNFFLGGRVIAVPTFSNMAAARHLQLAFCDSGPPTKSTMQFDCLWKLRELVSIRYLLSKICDFCRAMLSISAAVAVMRCPSVCPSVRLSRSWIMSKRTNIFSKYFSPSGSHTILVFPHRTGWRYSHGNPLTGASNAGGKKAEIAILV